MLGLVFFFFEEMTFRLYFGGDCGKQIKQVMCINKKEHILKNRYERKKMYLKSKGIY
jgi:hypothetical protein